MNIQTVDNINFQGFNFIDAHARKNFYLKLYRLSKEEMSHINNYLETTKDESAQTVINATSKARADTGEYLLYATFSNSSKLVVENSKFPGTERLRDFLSRCASIAGYKPL